MLTVKQIADYLESKIPSEMKMDFDNVGFLVGRADAPVTKVMVALDATDDVIDEAAVFGAELIVTHHPVAFSFEQTGKRINDETVAGERIVRMLEKGVAAICLHTNLDSAVGGVNDALAETLGISIEGWIEGPFYTVDGREYGIGRRGSLGRSMDMRDFLSTVKNALNVNGLRYHDAGRTVSKVAVGGGSCGELLEAAAALGCDTFVTADLKYDRFLAAKELGINLIDADHFCTENVIVPVLSALIQEGFPGLEVKISQTHGETTQFFM